MKTIVKLTFIVSISLTISCTTNKNEDSMIAVKKILDQQINKDKTPGLQYYFFDQDTIIYNYTGGLADIKNKKIVTENTTFNAYSVTKTFTALAILQLVENGSLQLDDPVSKYMIEFPYPENITIKQLLTHSAGIPNPIPLKWIHSIDEDSTFNFKTYFKPIFQKNIHIKGEPNEKFVYSNLGYVLLGLLIEEITGQTYIDYVTEQIIQKMDIHPNQLGFNIPNIDLHAKGYQKRWSWSSLILGFMFDKSKYLGGKEGKWRTYQNSYVNGPSYGGLIGTGSAFVTYIQELLKSNNKLLSKESMTSLFIENITQNGKPSKMCLSWFKGEFNGHTYYTHAGGGFYYCEIRLYPEINKGSVISFNRTGMSDERYLDNIDKYFLINDKNQN